MLAILVATWLLASSLLEPHLADAGLTVTGAAPGTFTATLNGVDQDVYTTLGTYTARQQGGPPRGWNITFQATLFSCTHDAVINPDCPPAGDTFPADSLSIEPPTVSPTDGVTTSISTITAIDTDAVAVTVASADPSVSKDTDYVFTPTAFTGSGTTPTSALQLLVPSSAYAATYDSTLTVSIATGP
jgi:hypothetical protein